MDGRKCDPFRHGSSSTSLDNRTFELGDMLSTFSTEKGVKVREYLFIYTNAYFFVADWETVRGLMENAIYGGRVENSLDIGVLQAYLENFFSNRLITGTDTGAHLASGIELPAFSSIEEYPKWIHSRIPVEDNPSFFGLPRNIVFSWEISKSAESIGRLRHLQTQATAKSGFSREAWNTLLSPILNLWKRLNQNSNMHSMDEPSPTPSDDPIVEVLSLEFAHAVRLVRKTSISSFFMRLLVSK